MSDEIYQEALRIMYVVLRNENKDRKWIESIWGKWEEMKGKLSRAEMAEIDRAWKKEVNRHVH
jgi:hypothetical protein